MENVVKYICQWSKESIFITNYDIYTFDNFDIDYHYNTFIKK